MPPLAGLRVLDFTLNLPGPYATALLVAQGADVVKVEPPRGDPGRHLTTFFERLNQGKRSLVLDLRDEADRAALPALFAWADVVIEGFRPGVMERLGAGPDDVHAVNPRAIYCRVSAYGQQGPRAQDPGHDLNLQALTGLCDLERDQAPRAMRLPVADLSASMAAVAAIGIALAGPRENAVLDVSMAGTLQHWTWVWSAVDPGALAAASVDQAPKATRGLLRRALGPLRRRLRREKLYAMPQYGLYRARDGWIALGIVDERAFWENCADALGLQRYRSLNMATLTLLGPWVRRRIASRIQRETVAHWVTTLGTRGVPVTPVLTPEQARENFVAEGTLAPPLPGSVFPEGPIAALGSTKPTDLR